jgi:hypothetical protein
MSTVKEHLAGAYGRASEFHKNMAENETTKAKHFTALAEAHDGDISKTYRKCAKACEEAATLHTGHSDHYNQMQKAIETMRGASKAMGHDRVDGDMVVPDRVSSVIRKVPGVTLVPRYGQPELGKASVPEEFRQFVEVEDD